MPSDSATDLDLSEKPLSCSCSPKMRATQCREVTDSLAMHTVTGHSTDCLGFHFQARHDLRLEDMRRALSWYFKLQCEPHAGRIQASRLCLQLESKVPSHSLLKVTVDLSIAEADSVTAAQATTEADRERPKDGDSQGGPS